MISALHAKTLKQTTNRLKLRTVKLGYNKHGFNKPQVITNTFFSPKSMYNT